MGLDTFLIVIFVALPLILETMQAFKSNEISDVIEVGPGNVLQGLVKRFDKTLRVHSFSNIEDINSIKQVL